MGKGLLGKAKEWRELVLLAELAGWLHDLGKLSARFILSKTDPAYATLGMEERTKESENGKWVHGDVFEYDRKHIPRSLAEFLLRPFPIPEGCLDGKQTSLTDLVSKHHDSWSELGAIEKSLKQADRLDSGEDQYNAANIPQREPIQTATVFGQERPLLDGDLDRLDQIRVGVYKKLEALVEDFPTTRMEIWECLQEAMRQGLGKTQRAANDIRLDQHAWGVATRFKAFLLRDLLPPRLRARNTPAARSASSPCTGTPGQPSPPTPGFPMWSEE